MLDTPADLQALLNLSKYHREHEKFYSHWPLDCAIRIQKASQTLSTLAARWDKAVASKNQVRSHYAGCEDLNEVASIQSIGVMFMEGEAEPPEIGRLKRDLRSLADDFDQTGVWLSHAMASTWEAAGDLLPIADLAAVLGERHRIIANDWLAASMNSLMARLIRRAVDIVDRLDLSPVAVRADLFHTRSYPQWLYSAVEMLDRAATLATESAALVHDNDRRWRSFRAAVQEVVARAARASPSAARVA